MAERSRTSRGGGIGRRGGRSVRVRLRPPPRLAVVALLSLVGCGGCSPAYLLRSAYEEARILWRREPIAQVIAQPGIGPAEREKLETVLAARAFARDALGLDVNGAYASYSAVPDGALLQVVSAAERLWLRPYTWWFPIVGRVSYKGFFEKSEAEAEARRLEEEGYDTYVRPSAAFSTLGWFDDPVLSSWLVADREQLVELVLHELLHRTTYLAGQTAFNESFANFVGHHGAVAFFSLAEGEGSAAAEKARKAWQAELAASARLMDAMRDLRILYVDAKQEHRPLGLVLEQRDAIFARLGDPRRINNAVILARAAYQDRLDWFDAALAGSGGDLRVAIARIRAASEAKADAPWQALDALRPAALAEASSDQQIYGWTSAPVVE
jgi:predicted aminopeptidase